MSRIRGFVLLSLSLLLVISCEEDVFDDNSYTRDRYLGSWDVQETEGLSAPQHYSVEIVEGSGSDDIVIKGLYNIQGTSVEAYVAGSYLSIDRQESQGFTFEGSGKANSDFEQLTLDFSVNDGADTDQVKAVLSK